MIHFSFSSQVHECIVHLSGCPNTATMLSQPLSGHCMGILLFDMLQGDIPFEEDHKIIRAEIGFQVPISHGKRE